MKTCYICNNQIKVGKRAVLIDGIKYCCSTPEDLVKCNEFVSDLKQKEFDNEQKQLAMLEGIVQCNSCNLYCKNYRVIETIPPKNCCPFCDKVN